MRKYLLICGLLLVSLTQAQEPDTLWTWVDDFPSGSRSYAVAPTSSNGSVLVGLSDYSLPHGTVLTVLDENGNEVYAWEDPEPPDENSHGFDVIETSPGVYYVAERINTTTSIAALSRVEETSGQAWRVAYPSSNSESARKVLQLEDGTFALGIRSADPEDDYSDHVRYIHVDADGAVLHDTLYAPETPGAEEVFGGMFLTGDGTITIATWHDSSSLVQNDRTVKVRHINPDGTVVDDFHFGVEEGTYVRMNDAARMPNGNIAVWLVVGCTSMIAVMTPEGELVWEFRRLSGGSGGQGFQKIVPLSNGAVLALKEGSSLHYVYANGDVGEEYWELNDPWYFNFNYSTTTRNLAVAYDGTILITGDTEEFTEWYNSFVARYEVPNPPPVPGTSLAIQAQVETITTDLIVDDNTVAKLHEDATDGFDVDFDQPKPQPPSSNFISVYFPHPEWEVPTGSNFQVDVRNGNDDLVESSKTWAMLVETDQVGQTVDLAFSIDEIPEDVDITLHDPDTGLLYDLRETSTISFTVGEEPKPFNLILGTLTLPDVSWVYPAEADSVLPAGTEIPLTWAADAGAGIASCLIEVSYDLGTSWETIADLEGNPGLFAWQAPELYSVYCMLRITVEDGTGAQAAAQVDRFTLAPFALVHPVASGWSLISPPLLHLTGSVDDMFGDDLTDPAFFYDYQEDGTYDVVETLISPNGYWLANTGDSAVLTLEGIPWSPLAYQPLQVGWNLVGNGLPINTAVDSLAITDSTSIIVHYNDAVLGGLINPAIYGFDPVAGGYTLPDSLKAWQGQWLHVNQPNLFLVTYQSPWWLPAPTNGDNGGLDELDDVDSWFLTIALEQGERSEQISGFGVEVDATVNFDVAYDYPSPPGNPSGEVLSAVLLHPEWENQLGDRFARDVRAPLEEGETTVWTVTIESSEEGDVSLTIPGIVDLIPEGYTAVAVVNDVEQDLFENETLMLPGAVNSEVEIHVTSATASVDQQSTLPTRFGIARAYPNPFNPTINITLALPRNEAVTFTVFNVLGQRVAHSDIGVLQAGHHTFAWGGSQPSGLYFLQVRSASGELAMRKVMRLK